MACKVASISLPQNILLVVLTDIQYPTLSDSGIITPSLALASFLNYFGNPAPPLKGAIVSVYQAGGK